MIAFQLLLLSLLGFFALAEVDYYRVLGVDIDSDDKAIKKAFRKLSMQYHPDKNAGNEEAAAKFLEINKAYEILSNEDKRMIYDMDGQDGLDRFEKNGGRRQSNNPLEMLFGGGGGGGGRGRGQDFRSNYAVTLEDLYNSAEKQLSITRNVLCRSCRGTGAKDGNQKVCKTCKGTGQVAKMQRLGPGFNVQMQSPCDACGGKGKTAVTKCNSCRGKKIQKEQKTLDVFIEKGMPNGFEVRFKRAGEQSPSTTPGDVILVLQTERHRTFTRDRNDLRMDMTITLKEALVGFRKTFRHLDGREVVVTRDEVTPPDHVKVLKGEGMPHHEVSSEHGNLFITFKIAFPKKITAAQREVIESLL